MRQKKKLYITLGIVQLIIALGAIPAGVMFLIEPDGSLMGMNSNMLSHSPFTDFTIPALFLLIVNGAGNILGAMLSFQFVDASGKTGIILGLILIMWIAIQVFWMGYTSFLQPVMGVIGIIELVFGYSVYINLKKLN